jgi:hypothetical protein
MACVVLSMSESEASMSTSAAVGSWNFSSWKMVAIVAMSLLFLLAKNIAEVEVKYQVPNPTCNANLPSYLCFPSHPTQKQSVPPSAQRNGVLTQSGFAAHLDPHVVLAQRSSIRCVVRLARCLSRLVPTKQRLGAPAKPLVHKWSRRTDGVGVQGKKTRYVILWTNDVRRGVKALSI